MSLDAITKIVVCLVVELPAQESVSLISYFCLTSARTSSAFIMNQRQPPAGPQMLIGVDMMQQKSPLGPISQQQEGGSSESKVRIFPRVKQVPNTAIGHMYGQHGLTPLDSLYDQNPQRSRAQSLVRSLSLSILG